MWKLTSVAFLAISLCLVNACSDDDDDAGGGSLCADSCAKSLDCPNDDTMTCLAQCEQAQASSCSTEADAYARCVIARPDSDLECDEDGETNLKDGVCEAEFEAALACAVGGG